MEKTIAKSFCIELNPVHLKLDGKLPSSVFLAKAETTNHHRTITKDMWYKLHPTPYCRSKKRFYRCSAIPAGFIPDDRCDGYDR